MSDSVLPQHEDAQGRDKPNAQVKTLLTSEELDAILQHLEAEVLGENR